jgi:hypothetical protein
MDANEMIAAGERNPRKNATASQLERAGRLNVEIRESGNKPNALLLPAYERALGPVTTWRFLNF